MYTIRLTYNEHAHMNPDAKISKEMEKLQSKQETI